MIVRIRIVHADDVDTNNEIYSWGLFIIPESTTLSEIFLGIKSGRFSCGPSWKLEEYDDIEFQCFAATQRSVPDYKDMMPAHKQLKIGDLKDREALYLQSMYAKIWHVHLKLNCHISRWTITPSFVYIAESVGHIVHSILLLSSTRNAMVVQSNLTFHEGNEKHLSRVTSVARKRNNFQHLTLFEMFVGEPFVFFYTTVCKQCFLCSI